MEHLRIWMEWIGIGIDLIGVAVIVLGVLLATVRLIFVGHGDAGRSYHLYRQDMGRSILLGLEFLVAGDIIRTVAVDPTLENVGVLGVIILIRTLLSITLELELEGRWPWQRTEQAQEELAGPSTK